MIIGGGYLPRTIIKAAAGILKGYEGKIADIACGTGVLLKELGERYKERIIGVDSDQKHVITARQEGMHVVEGNMFKLPFEDVSFDLAVCFNTLMNFSSLAELGPAFLEMARITRDGGRIMVDIRNKLNPVMRLKYWLHMRKRGFAAVSYSTAEIETAMRAVGCRLVLQHAVGMNNPYLAWGYIMVFEKESGQK